MKPSRIRTGLLTLLATALLGLGGTAQAQLEEFTQLLDDDLSFFDPLFLKFTNGDVQKITVRGTIDTTPNPEDNGVGPVFGISGAEVPMVAHVFIDISKVGPIENLAEGSDVGGNTLLSDFIGYKENQILGIYLVIGGPTGPRKEVGFLNASGLAPRLPATALDSREAVTGFFAEAWFDDLVDTGEPQACEFFLLEGASQFQMGSFGGTPVTDFSNSIWVYDSIGGNYAFGNVTSVDAVDASEALGRVLRNKAIAERILRQAQAKAKLMQARVNKNKQLAKRKKVKPNQFAPLRKALAQQRLAIAAVKRARIALRSLGLNPVK